MSQVGNIVSISSGTPYGCSANCWSVQFSYLLDAGGQGTAEVYVGSPIVPNLGGVVPVPPWTSAASTISVTATGAAAPVLLACPYVVQKTTFGVNG